MIKVTLFPNFVPDPKDSPNPYISDYVSTLNESGKAKVVNKACKSTLLSLLKPGNQGDVFIFNWFESIPDAKHWLLHTVVAVFLVLWLKIRHKTIIWMLHNKESHAVSHQHLKAFMGWFIARLSTFIVTHSKEGVELVKYKYPFAGGKVHFLHHPTKDRIRPEVETIEKKYDLLIWGNISRYKGVIEFLQFLKNHPMPDVRICIAGRCTSRDIQKEIEEILPKNVLFRPESLLYSQLGTCIAEAEFVLVPYNPESVLSSGILMDSLSYGAKVIGPAVGSFKDYAEEPLLDVFTFHSFEDIPGIISQYKGKNVPLADYHTFLQGNDWPHFVEKLIELIHNYNS